MCFAQNSFPHIFNFMLTWKAIGAKPALQPCNWRVCSWGKLEPSSVSVRIECSEYQHWQSWSVVFWHLKRWWGQNGLKYRANKRVLRTAEMIQHGFGWKGRTLLLQCSMEWTVHLLSKPPLRNHRFCQKIDFEQMWHFKTLNHDQLELQRHDISIYFDISPLGNSSKVLSCLSCA